MSTTETAAAAATSTIDNDKIEREWSNALGGVHDELAQHSERKHTMQRVLHIVKSVEKRIAAPSLPTPAPAPATISSSGAKTTAISTQSKQAIKDMCLKFAMAAETQMAQINGCLSKVTEAVEKLEKRKQEVVLQKARAHSTGVSKAAEAGQQPGTNAPQSIRQLEKLKQLLKQARLEHQMQRSALDSALRQQITDKST